MSLKKEQLFVECTIEKLVHEGYGLARTEQGVIFVEQVLPAEKIVARVVSDSKKGMRAQLHEIQSPSPHRREPACPFALQCGGCNWQHIDYPAALEYKKAILIECLERIAKIRCLPAIEVFESPPLNYRIRVQMKSCPEKLQLGFFAKGSNSIVPIDSCCLLVPQLNNLFNHSQTICTTLQNSGYHELKAIASDTAIASQPVVKNVTTATTIMTIDNARFMVSGNSFFQCNKFLLQKLGTWPRSGISTGGGRCIDMFGGQGFFSLMLGDLFSEVILVEAASELVAQGRSNFLCSGMSHLKAVHLTAEECFKKSILRPTDFLIVDPPRPGLSTLVRRGIQEVKPKRLLSVSCNPATFSRDTGFLVKSCGYTLDRLALFDMYPQTHHSEIAAFLIR